MNSNVVLLVDVLINVIDGYRESRTAVPNVLDTLMDTLHNTQAIRVLGLSHVLLLKHNPPPQKIGLESTPFLSA